MKNNIPYLNAIQRSTTHFVKNPLFIRFDIKFHSSNDNF